MDLKIADEEVLKKILNFLLKNYALIFFIPTFLGGLWQLYALASLDLSYIRFFSVSQLVADGLIVSVFMILLLSPVIAFVALILRNKFQNPNLAAIFGFVNYLVLGFTTIMVVKFEFNFWDKLIYLLSILLLISFPYILNYIKGITKKEVFLFAVYFTGVFIIFPFLFTKFNEKLLLPENIININLNNYKNLKKADEKVKLLYYNDKYVFLEISQGNNKKNRIVEFEKFFFSDFEIIKN